MEYTLERLERARALFQRRVGDPFIPPDVAGAYKLRNRTPKRARVLASWHDNEQDEDYDPFISPTQKRRCQQFKGGSPDLTPIKKTGRTFLPSKSIPRLNEAPKIDHPPSPSSSEDSEFDHLGRYWDSPNTDAVNSRYGLRPRGKYETSDNPPARGTPLTEASLSPDDKHRIKNPSRGCTACQDIGMECSLTTDPDPLAYPCVTCEQDGIECVVTPEPEWKRSCEGCRRRRAFCSYRYTNYDHSKPCQPCVNHGFKCVAGPAKCRSLNFHTDHSSEFEDVSAPFNDTEQPEPSDSMVAESC
jgi:hypothetical protein